VTRDLLERGVLKRAGVVREGGEGIPVYTMPGSSRVYDLRALLASEPEPGTVAAPPVPIDREPPPVPIRPKPIVEGLRVPQEGLRATLDAIRLTVTNDWVSHGLDTSLETVLDQISEGLGDEDLRMVIWADRLDIAMGEGRRWELLPSHDARGASLRQRLEQAGGAPIVWSGRRWAAIELDHQIAGAIGLDAKIDLGLLDAAADTLGELLLAFGRSQRRVYTDPLTGLNNRGFFENQLGLELERARRLGSPLALLFADLDHFKRINDEHGHEVGDLMLQHLARLMVSHLRRIDQVFRWGGEEFALLLPGTAEVEAEFTADRLRRVVAATPLRIGAGNLVQCTLSIGIALAPEHASGGERALLRHADQALYAAKQSGRNRVVVFGRDA
jgi:diguanylate cyclase (GGDEF)-like protein